MAIHVKAGDLVASKYRLISRLGQGGMGAVWSAANVQTGKEFAIKFLHPMIASSSDDARSRFLQEAKASARVNHPNIIDIFDVGETEDNALFLVMELLEGLSLQDAMRAEPAFSVRELLIVLAGAAMALGAAHGAGIIHRDVKPPNIFLARDRNSAFVRTKLLDFGVSKVAIDNDGIATHTGSMLGSPRYMAPEQAVNASQADARADLWSLGVILFEGITGVFPHEGDNSNAIVIAIAMQPPRPIASVAPHLPLPLRELIDDCLKPKDQRLKSAQEFVDRVIAILQQYDLSEMPLARPVNSKKVVPRPDHFVIETAGSQPGVGALLQGSAAMSLGAVRAQIASLSGAGVPAPAPPPARAPLDDEDATMIRVDPRELVVPRQELAAGLSGPSSAAPTSGGAPPGSASGPGSQAGSPTSGAPLSGPLPPGPSDPGESISSINVARGLPFPSVAPPAPTPNYAQEVAALKGPPLPRSFIYAMAGLGLVGLVAVIVIVQRSGSDEPAAASSLDRSNKPTAAVTTAREAAVAPTNTESATASATASASQSSQASASASSLAAKTSKTGDSNKPKVAPPTGTAASKTSDPFRDLGSGIKIKK